MSTVLVSDGETSLMTDGFFTRPGGAVRLLLGGKVSPGRAVVEGALRRAGVRRLAAVVCGHSHYGHAMDAPLVAELSGATLVGSESTATIGRGGGLAEDRIVVPAPGERLHSGSSARTSPHRSCLRRRSSPTRKGAPTPCTSSIPSAAS